MIARCLSALLGVIVLDACAHSSASSAAVRARPTDSIAAPMLVVVVRHGEKAPEPASDPVLSAAGLVRAASLDSAVRRLLVTDVVVSQLQRTRLTASVVTARTGAPVHVVPITGTGVEAHVKAVADTVRALSRMRGHRGVLVVGHSNTVTLIVQALGGAALRSLCDSQYSQIFVLREQGSGLVNTERSAYGAKDPDDPACAGMNGRP